MRLSLRNRCLLMLLAVLATAWALTPAAMAQYCYLVEVRNCFYGTEGYCYFSCPSASYCVGDLSGTPSCHSEGIECCY